MQGTPINKSSFSEEFEDTDSSGIIALDKSSSLRIWNTHIDNAASSYFNLQQGNWIVKSNKSVIGKWISDFNSNESENIQSLLDTCVDWNNDDLIYFCISKFIIIKTNWLKFKELWINFITCEEDCPIIINERKTNAAIIFTAIGDIIKINSKT